jgi:beta-glucosidase
MIDRRHILTTGLAISAATVAGASEAKSKNKKSSKRVGTFPKDFYWGAATAAYQIEGAYRADGKGESIWDRFVLAPGKIDNGDTGNVACDSYNRLDEDLALLKALGIKSYRFSIAWTRIQAEGRGLANEKGLDYYKRLTDGLLNAGIRPLVTLYHWDLPQALEDRGGWPNRDTAGRFVDYSEIMARALGDKIKSWGIFNEPRAFTELGYLIGVHAPGRKDPRAFFQAAHVVNIAQGQAFKAIKAINPKLEVGTAVDSTPVYAQSQKPEDIAAAERQHQFINLWFLKPALTGAYPDILTPEQYALMEVKPGDDKLMQAPLEFVGLNNYTYATARHDDNATNVPNLKTAWTWGQGPEEKSDIGWVIKAPTIYDLVVRISKDIGSHIPLEITENGGAFNEVPGPDGRVRDERRLNYYKTYLTELSRALHDGVPLRGYHAWSLMDNFEWAKGYKMRFGIVHVDYKTQKRTIKDSGLWYSKVIKAGKVI